MRSVSVKRSRDRLEAKLDLDAARKALRERGERVSWKQLKAELGL